MNPIPSGMVNNIKNISYEKPFNGQSSRILCSDRRDHEVGYWETGSENGLKVIYFNTIKDGQLKQMKAKGSYIQSFENSEKINDFVQGLISTANQLINTAENYGGKFKSASVDLFNPEGFIIKTKEGKELTKSNVDKKSLEAIKFSMKMVSEAFLAGRGMEDAALPLAQSIKSFTDMRGNVRKNNSSQQVASQTANMNSANMEINGHQTNKRTSLNSADQIFNPEPSIDPDNLPDIKTLDFDRNPHHLKNYVKAVLEDSYLEQELRSMILGAKFQPRLKQAGANAEKILKAVKESQNQLISKAVTSEINRLTPNKQQIDKRGAVANQLATKHPGEWGKIRTYLESPIIRASNSPNYQIIRNKITDESMLDNSVNKMNALLNLIRDDYINIFINKVIADFPTDAEKIMQFMNSPLAKASPEAYGTVLNVLSNNIDNHVLAKDAITKVITAANIKTFNDILLHKHPEKFNEILKFIKQHPTNNLAKVIIRELNDPRESIIQAAENWARATVENTREEQRKISAHQGIANPTEPPSPISDLSDEGDVSDLDS